MGVNRRSVAGDPALLPAVMVFRAEYRTETWGFVSQLAANLSDNRRGSA